MREKCFVDENLLIVSDPGNAKAIVNSTSLPNRLQILFLEPIANYKNWLAANRAAKFWVSVFYPKFTSFSALPSIEICNLANAQKIYPKVSGCFTSASVQEQNALSDLFWMIDEDGKPRPAQVNEVIKNVYPALYIDTYEFNTLNSVDFHKSFLHFLPENV